MRPRLKSFSDELQAILAPTPRARAQRKMIREDSTGNAKTLPYSEGALTTAPVDGGGDVAVNILNPATGPGGV